MALTATPTNSQITHREGIRCQRDVYTATLACSGAAEIDGALTLRGVAQKSAVQVQRMTFNVSTSGAAGTHSASVTLPAGSTLLDIVVHAVTLWDSGTSASMDVGDNTDPNGYFAAIDLKATDLLAGESISFTGHGGKAGAYIVGTLPTGHWESRYQAASRTVEATIVTLGTATTGETVVDVYYSIPSSSDISAATFA